MQDFVIETLTTIEIQKHLRQWRHEYHIKVIHYSVINVDPTNVVTAHIVVERTKKS